MWPATPSSKPKREKRRKAAARRSLRWRRSAAGVAKTGGRGTRSMKAPRADEAADVDGCGMGTSVRKELERGIVPERAAVGKTEVKSDGARAAVRKAGLLPLVFVMFAYATGGTFGLEDMVTTSGPGLTLLYHLFIPFFWCIPVSLVAAELTTAIPVEGGFYRWVRAAFGDFWGFQAGWWNWSASFLLGGTYGVLTADYLTNYLSFYFTVPGWMHYVIAVGVIALIGYINVRGIQMVGRVATILEISILVPIVTLCVIAATKWHHNPFSPLPPPHVPRFQVFGSGLALGLWLYSGSEQVSSVAEVVENLQRSHPISVALVMPLSLATNFPPAMFSLAA